MKSNMKFSFYITPFYILLLFKGFIVLKHVYILLFLLIFNGNCGSAVAKVLCYKSEGRWFGPTWCH